MLITELTVDIDLDEDAQEVVFEIDVTSTVDARKQALLEIRLFDEYDAELRVNTKVTGKQITPSAQFGAFAYLVCGVGTPAANSVRIPVTPGARQLRIRGHRWAGKGVVEFTGKPTVTQVKRGDDTVFDPAPGSDRPTPVPIDFLVATYEIHEGTDYELTTLISGPSDAKGLLLPAFYDADDEPLLPPGNLPVSPEFGPYYEAARESTDKHIWGFTAPKRAAKLRIEGKQWAGGTVEVRDRPELRQKAATSASDDQVASWIHGVPAADKLVVIYTTAGAIGSGTLLLRSNRLALEYAEAGWWVVFFPFSELKEDEPQHPHERVLQLGRSRFRVAFDALIKRRGPQNVLLCSTFSDVRMVGSLDRAHDAGWRVIYEMRDDMEEFQRVGYAKWYDAALESRFARRADALVAVSPRLQEKLEVMTGREVLLVPNAAPDALVDSTAGLRTLEAWDKRTGRNKVGYIGHLTESWFDWEKVLEAAHRLPFTFEIIGHGMPTGMALPRNVTYLGPKSHDECLEYAAEWSVGLIPFKISRLTYGVDPNKVYEYVAMGLRTVSAPMGQVDKIPGVAVYQTQEEFISALEKTMAQVVTESECAAYREYAESARWTQRARTMLEILEGR